MLNFRSLMSLRKPGNLNSKQNCYQLSGSPYREELTFGNDTDGGSFLLHTVFVSFGMLRHFEFRH